MFVIIYRKMIDPILLHCLLKINLIHSNLETIDLYYQKTTLKLDLIHLSMVFRQSHPQSIQQYLQLPNSKSKRTLNQKVHFYSQSTAMDWLYLKFEIFPSNLSSSDQLVILDSYHYQDMCKLSCYPNIVHKYGNHQQVFCLILKFTLVFLSTGQLSSLVPNAKLNSMSQVLHHIFQDIRHFLYFT